MARKTAMKSEPKGGGRVSIAVPKSEKERFLPPVKPPPMDNKGNFMQPKPQRLSPGVYRGAGGGLVNSKGRPLPGQSNKQPPAQNAVQSAIQGAAQGISQGMGGAPRQEMPQGMMQEVMQGATQGAQGLQNNIQGMADQAGFYTMPAMRPQGGMSMDDINRFGMADIRNMPQQGIQDAMLRLSPEEQQRMQANMPQNLMYQYPPGQQFPINDLAYRYPAGQVPNFGALFNYGQRQQEQQQQPNSVSGLLQRRFR